jgi:hypothetical protein
MRIDWYGDIGDLVAMQGALPGVFALDILRETATHSAMTNGN